ncbi:tyrosine-type recombinase/integrase [Deinococcus altitudinis]|uniref:tyrosine-type recombinase/integrase n=1 Tax=Deinococcus altitudinis TaxID=468914 RepID=UPI003891B3AA
MRGNERFCPPLATSIYLYRQIGQNFDLRWVKPYANWLSLQAAAVLLSDGITLTVCRFQWLEDRSMEAIERDVLLAAASRFFGFPAGQVLAACKIFFDQGKSSKDRYILFPQTFGLVLRTHLAAHPQQVYLFETQRCEPYTVRRVQQIVQRYREAAGLSANVHPHLFRHQMPTFLTGQKLSEAQIQLLSGHVSKESLEIYQHLSLDAVDAAYQQEVRLLDLLEHLS